MKDKPIIVKIPLVNVGDEFVKVVDICFENGEYVFGGQVILCLETSKTVIDIEAPGEGFAYLNIEIGNVYPVGYFAAKITRNPISEIELNTLFNNEINPNYCSSASNETDVSFSKAAQELIIKHNLDKNQFAGKSFITKQDVLDLMRMADETGGGVNDNYSSVGNIKKSGKSMRENHISSHKLLQHGANCFVDVNVSLSNVVIGDQTWINKNATIYSGSNIVRIGSGCYIGPYVFVEGHAGIVVGDCVHIAGPGTCLYTHSGMKIALNGELIGNPSFHVDHGDNYFEIPIAIGDRCWIGPNCTIFPGVKLGHSCVVLPNTLVRTGDYPPFTLFDPSGNIERNSYFIKSLINT